MENMIKFYKGWKETADNSWWRKDEATYNSHPLDTGANSTVKERLLKKFEDLFQKHLDVNRPALVESGQPIRRDGNPLELRILGGHDPDMNWNGE